MIRLIYTLFQSKSSRPNSVREQDKKELLEPLVNPIGLIAGSGSFPLRFCREAQKAGRDVVAIAHKGETRDEILDLASYVTWIKVGELGRIIDTFKSLAVKEVALAGGIDRIRIFGGVKLDMRGAALLAKVKSTKDDVIMRGIAEELSSEGIEVVACTVFLKDCLAKEGVLTLEAPQEDDWEDIRVGQAALRAISGQDIGQLVVVKQGVVVAVEAIEGSDETILRGGALGGPGTVVVKSAKTTQDMRFDVPTIGVKTIEVLHRVKAKVLALESTRCLILDEKEVIELANKYKIAIVGYRPLIDYHGQSTE